MINLKKTFWYIFIPLIILVFFSDPLENTLSTFIVNPLFSKIRPSFWLYDLVAISILIISVVLGYRKIIRGAHIPFNWVLMYTSYLILYIWYRYTNHPFSFSSFSFKEELKLLDLLNGIPLVLIILDFATRFYLKWEKTSNSNKINSRLKEVVPNNLEENNKESAIQGFAVDEPVFINRDYDILNRMKFIENLSEMILKTESNHGSFPIGIVAPWGSGKTTFLRALKLNLDKELILLELDVWRCKSTDQIIETFFDLLKQKLKPYSFTINNKITDYSKSLVSDSGNVIINNLSKNFFSNKTVEQQYNQLKNEIEIINKKVAVIIDDIDRLDKKEIYEVIRLIRNTANFGNIFFVVAYDRNYILNAIEAINPYNSHTFLEKVFQVEYSLPPIGKKILSIEIKTKLNAFLSPKDKKAFSDFFKIGFQYEFDRLDLTSLFVTNMRDVIRFVNLFQINYQFLKEEIFVGDFYNLQLIRFKHPEIYIQFFKKKSLFIFSGARKNYHPQKFTYALIIKEKTKDKIHEGEIVFKSYLQNKKDVYKINDNEIEIITNSFLRIFPNHDNYNYSRRDTYLSVVQPSMFDRYFVLDIQDKLSMVEFSRARNLELKLFKNKIIEWGGNKNFKDDLVEYLLQIKDFDNTEDFEKIIQAIFCLGQIININLTYIQDIFLTHENKVLNLYYENNDQIFKDFILGLFDNAKSPYLFESRLLKFLDKHYYEPNIFLIPKEKVNDLSIYYLKTYSSKIEKIDSQLWDLYWYCERTYHTDRKYTSEMPEAAKCIMKDFILSKDFDTYLKDTIGDEPFNHKKFQIRNSVLNVFDSWENFEIILNEQDEKKWEGLEEYKRFFADVKKSGFSLYIEFQFDVIKPNLGKISKVL